MGPKNGTNQFCIIHGTCCQRTTCCLIGIVTASTTYDVFCYCRCNYGRRHWLCAYDISALAAVKPHIVSGNLIQTTANDDASHPSSRGLGCPDSPVATFLNDPFWRESDFCEKCSFASTKLHTTRRRPFHSTASGLWRKSTSPDRVVLSLERARLKTKFQTNVLGQVLPSTLGALSGEETRVLAQAKPTSARSFCFSLASGRHGVNGMQLFDTTGIDLFEEFCKEYHSHRGETLCQVSRRAFGCWISITYGFSNKLVKKI